MDRETRTQDPSSSMYNTSVHIRDHSLLGECKSIEQKSGNVEKVEREKEK
jgi:hypothetical protein